MRKILLAVSIVTFLTMGSCSSDDNSAPINDPPVNQPGDGDNKVDEPNPLIGKWIPENVKVTAMGNEMANLGYPHMEGCEEDYLIFEKNKNASFTYHNDICKAESQTQKWIQDKDLLKFNLLGSDIEVKVIENTAKTLVVSGNGEQFESLIPIFLPEANIPPFLLASAVVELSLKK